MVGWFEQIGARMDDREKRATELNAIISGPGPVTPTATTPATPTPASGSASTAGKGKGSSGAAKSAMEPAPATPVLSKEAAEEELAELEAADEVDTKRVQEIYKRLDQLDAASAESRAAEVRVKYG